MSRVPVLSQSSALADRPTARSPILGSTTPRLWTPPAVVGEPGPCGCGCALTPASSKGFEAVEFAERVLGFRLIPWQRWLLIHGLELDLFGCYRFRTVLCLVGRQNGKTTLLAVLSLYRMLLDGARLVLGTSTKLEYAQEAWAKAAEQAEHCAALAAEFKLTGRNAAVRRVNGDVTLTALNGSRYKIATANEEGGRSLSVDLLILDELRQHKTWAAWSASSKTTNARPDGQRWAISNQGDRTGVVLNRLRAVALAGIGVEVPAEQEDDGEPIELDDSLMLAEWSAPDGCELTDPQALAQSNPSVGYQIAMSSLLADARTDPPDVFRVEVLCQRVDTLDSVIDAEAWGAGLDTTGTMEDLRSRVALCLDVAIDGSHASLVAAAILPDGRARVEVVAAWDGPGCVNELRAALPAWRERVRPRVVGWFPGGPAAALQADLKDARGVRALAGAEACAACQALVEDIKVQRVLHNGDPLLAAHLTGAGKLDTGDGYRFQRRGGGPVDAAYAAAGAVLLARTLPAAVGKPRIITSRGA